MENVRKALDGVFVNTIGTNADKPANTSVIALGTEGKTIRVSTNWNIESNSATVDDEAEEKLTQEGWHRDSGES